ncbi:DUF6477 family protein [Cognatishimia activa]|uniref:DUF6477 family protein n=1 Tax=Cognatishimia activa TaxID=1715691 RepID=UPI002231A76E|nr:DUF6477 family protein [Cognatishimia activa]UZD91968.1 DUF6477 family protein [Cognatishimia activa]
MQDVLMRVAQLNRPKLLVRTAKSAVKDYRRETYLARLFPGKAAQKHGAALQLLLDLENEHNDRRLHRRAGYSLADHLDVLIALIGEFQLLSELRNRSAPTR